MELSLSSVRLQDGWHAVGVVRDISDREQAEKALRESEEQYRTLVENASDIIYRTDDAGHFTFVNPAALRIIGYEENEIIGKHYQTIIRQDKREEAMAFFGRQFVKKIPNTYSEYPLIAKDGREIWIGQNTQLIFQDGKVVAFQSVALDITEIKQAEETIRQMAHSQFYHRVDYGKYPLTRENSPPILPDARSNILLISIYYTWMSDYYPKKEEWKYAV